MSRQLKKFFVRAPSSISQRGGKADGIQFQSVVLAMGGETLEWYNDSRLFRLQVLHLNMSNIIPLLFESSLSSSYANVSELAQAMQRLERHLAHVVNIRVTSKFSFVNVLLIVC